MLFAIGTIFLIIALVFIGRAIYFSATGKFDQVAEKALEGTPFSPDAARWIRLAWGILLLMIGLLMMFPSIIGNGFRIVLFLVGGLFCAGPLAYFTIPFARIGVEAYFGQEESTKLCKILFILGIVILLISRSL